jgi:hypothetical protein
MLKKNRSRCSHPVALSGKTASIQGNMRVKEARQQSHKISLLSALK